MQRVYFSLGSNIGVRKRYLLNAIDQLSQEVNDLKISSIYETNPWGKTNQAKFLNVCVSGETELKPDDLLKLVKAIEKKLGRIDGEKWGPREIDIDILFYGCKIIDQPDLKIPHPLISERAFVLVPLAEIAPDFVHPTLNKTIQELLGELRHQGLEIYISPKVMGILNATPDSFSDGGDIDDNKQLEKRIDEVIRQGAEIVDVGGESTRPGFKAVSTSEEIDRVVRVISAVRGRSKIIPISIDTQKSEVAKAAIDAGANIINDVSALSDSAMAKVAVKFDCPIILMRNVGIKNDVISETKKQFEQIINSALDSGIKKSNIILDPGLGFGDLKTQNFGMLPGGDVDANLDLIKKLGEYSGGYPVLIGGSRKRFIGTMMDEPEPKKRIKGSVEIAVMAAIAGASIVRVHDVKETVDALENFARNG